MSRVDLERLLQPISDAEPSGANLEYDAEFAEMERASQGTAEQQYGDTIIPAKEPDWADLSRLCLSLFERTKDLRVALHLTRSSLRLGGLTDFCRSLELLHGLVDRFWNTIHPQLDPDDDNDPTIRVNILASLCDVPTVITPLRATPIVRSRMVGSFSRRDWAIATGEISKPERRDSMQDEGSGEKLPDRQTIDAAFQSCDHAQLREMTAATEAGAKAVRSLENAVTREIGAGQMRSLAALAKELDGIHKILAEQSRRVIPAETSAAEEAPAEEAAAGDASDSGDSGSASGSSSAGASGAKKNALVNNWNAEVASRDDAIRLLEKVIQFYERHEPSSPLPLLLRRAMRLSSKSFLEILHDISPDGLGQAEALGGMTREEYLQNLNGGRGD